MIIKCLKKVKKCQEFIPVDSINKDIINPSITVGKEYVVLGLKIIPQKGIHVIILDENNKPLVTELLGFEAVTEAVTLRWDCDVINGIFYKMPKAWMNENFLNKKSTHEEMLSDFYKEAELTYQEERRSITWFGNAK